MSLASIIEALAAAGATPEMLAAAVRADQDERQAADDAVKSEKRAKAAERQRRKRERDNPDVAQRNALSRDVTSVTRDSLETKVSPRPPSKTQTLNTPSDPKGSSVPTILRFAKPNGFDRFWESYPRKVGKGAARKAFDRALPKIAAADRIGVLMAALDRVKPTWAEAQFIPHASTWLSEERWEDEPEIPPPKAGVDDGFEAARRKVLEQFGDGRSTANLG